jgi:hypothetical protein
MNMEEFLLRRIATADGEEIRNLRKTALFVT